MHHEDDDNDDEKTGKPIHHAVEKFCAAVFVLQLFLGFDQSCHRRIETASLDFDALA